MRESNPELEEALEEGRIGVFVHIDMPFFPMRVHNGTGKVKWDGAKWIGLSDALKAPFTTRPLSSSVVNPKGRLPPFEACVSLPMDRKLGEALIHGYYVNRDVTINLCALTEKGEVLERVQFNVGTITKCSTTDSNTVTLHVEDRSLEGSSNPLRDPRHDRDATHKAGIRSRFRQNVMGLAISQGKGELADVVAEWSFGPLGNILSSSLGRLSRLIRQRWAARKSRYKLEADIWGTGLPPLRLSYFGGLVKVPLTKVFRAYTEKEALERFHSHVAKIVWRAPRSFLQAQVVINGRPLPNMINLDFYREKSDPKRWADTDPLRMRDKD